MQFRPWWLLATMPVVVLAFARIGSAQADGAMAMSATDSFASDNAHAMDRMMSAMAVPSTGDTDRDFVATMVPHHQGAIDMALAELRFGKDETLRRMAQEIIVEQKQEIDAMKLAATRLPPTKLAGPTSADVCKGRSMSPPTHDPLVHEGH